MNCRRILRRGCGFIPCSPDRMANRSETAQISGDRGQIRVRDVAVGGNRHRRTDDRTVWSRAVAERCDDLPFGPFADAGFAVGRDIGTDNVPDHAVVKFEAAGQFHCGDSDCRVRRAAYDSGRIPPPC